MIKIKIDTGNAAFDDDNYNDEIARILRELARDFEHGRRPLTSYDINGNRCVTVEYTGKDRC